MLLLKWLPFGIASPSKLFQNTTVAGVTEGLKAGGGDGEGRHHSHVSVFPPVVHVGKNAI